MKKPKGTLEIKIQTPFYNKIMKKFLSNLKKHKYTITKTENFMKDNEAYQRFSYEKL